jgi:hypothetical protein
MSRPHATIYRGQKFSRFQLEYLRCQERLFAAIMSKKQLVVLLAALLAFGAYAVFFTDWFASENIRIVHTLRPYTPQKRGRKSTFDQPGNTVSFALDRKCKLTEVKVIPVADIATNKYPHPIWHLVSESNSVPLKGFVYGMSISGMHPAVPGSLADPLEPNVPYRLFVKTRDLNGEHEFKTTTRVTLQR